MGSGRWKVEKERRARRGRRNSPFVPSFCSRKPFLPHSVLQSWLKRTAVNLKKLLASGNISLNQKVIFPCAFLVSPFPASVSAACRVSTQKGKHESACQRAIGWTKIPAFVQDKTSFLWPPGDLLNSCGQTYKGDQEVTFRSCYVRKQWF